MKNQLKNIVKNVISDLEKREQKEQDIKKTWEQAAGKKAAGHTKLVFFKSKRLIVNVSDSSRLYELTVAKQEIIKKFNKNIDGRSQIKELQFRIGKIE